MKITAGVILILAAVLNLFACFGYLAGGALTTGMSEVASEVATEVANDPSAMTAEEHAQIQDGAADGKAIGGGLMIYGIFLLVSVGILIAGAVFLFKGTNPVFIRASGVVALLAEGIGILIVSFGIMNILGLVGGILAIIAAGTIDNTGESEAEAAPAE